MLALLTNGSTEKVFVSAETEAPVKEYPPAQDATSKQIANISNKIRFKAFRLLYNQLLRLLSFDIQKVNAFLGQCYALSVIFFDIQDFSS